MRALCVEESEQKALTMQQAILKLQKGFSDNV